MEQTQEARTVDEFLRSVLRSGLIDRCQLQTTLRAMPVSQRNAVDAVADFLVKQGKLTRFQARKLLSGACGGLVLGPFQVLAPIGKGGMGTVFLARDSRSENLVALKVLPPHKYKAEERLLARFRREMEMARRVAHPHVAWTYDVDICKSVYYIAMEYIPGQTLHRLVQEHGPLTVPRAARLFGEVAVALDHVHHQGLIHRDMKPGNVMVTPHDHAKLLDLGLALALGEKSVDRAVVGGQGYLVGTADFMAPEQSADPTKADARCDIYGLGCTLYFALTGRPPFPGVGNKEKIFKHRNEPFPAVEQINPAVPATFAAILNRMTAKDPGKRFQSAHEVELALKPWAQGSEIVLPLDKPSDETYVEAVSALEAIEPSQELVMETILVEGEMAEPWWKRMNVWVYGLLILVGGMFVTGLLIGWLLR